MLSALECFQIQLAKCKVLTKQEEEVVAANFMHLFKVEPKVMAEALTKLDELSTSLVLLRSSSWPASAEFDIENILIQVKALAKQAMEASFKVWANALIKASCTCVDVYLALSMCCFCCRCFIRRVERGRLGSDTDQSYRPRAS